MSILINIIKNHEWIFDYINCVNEECVNALSYSIYNHSFFEKSKIQYYEFSKYVKQHSKCNLIYIVIMYVINKNYKLFKLIDNNETNELKIFIDHYDPVIKFKNVDILAIEPLSFRLIVKLFAIKKILLKYGNVFKINLENAPYIYKIIIKEMNDVEKSCNQNYGLIGLHFDDYKKEHCNLLLYDKNRNIWIRIEPGGHRFYKNFEISIENIYSNFHENLDNHIKEQKNYISNNDYYFLPSLHDINNAGCCGYYATMLVEEYIINDDGNLFSLTEKFINHEYIKSKLLEYRKIINENQ